MKLSGRKLIKYVRKDRSSVKILYDHTITPNTNQWTYASTVDHTVFAVHAERVVGTMIFERNAYFILKWTMAYLENDLDFTILQSELKVSVTLSFCLQYNIHQIQCYCGSLL